jgi:ribose transport system ATP-binding protein
MPALSEAAGAIEGSPVLRVRGVSKAFGGTQALSQVDLDVARGSVHALLGGNGSGKSTLIKILAAQRARAAELIHRFGIPARPDSVLGDLGRATQTLVAIARALQDQRTDRDRVLVLDEPTASLPASEVGALLSALRGYADSGHTIIFVTHRLPEVVQVADRATVLRDGRALRTVQGDELDSETLVELIAGRRAAASARRGDGAASVEPVLRVSGLSGGSLRDASFTVRRNEIVGVAGLLGSGRSTLLRILFGLVARQAGEVHLRGAAISCTTPREAIRRGFAYVPEDRTAEAAFRDLTVLENLSIASLPTGAGGLVIDGTAERAEGRALIASFGISAPSERASFDALSGGNQQKAVLARWMRRSPQVLLLDEPSQGVDVGARADIYSLIRRAVSGGACALVVSSDAEELTAFCDRVLVLRAGHVVADLDGEDVNAEHLERLSHEVDLAAIEKAA